MVYTYGSVEQMGFMSNYYSDYKGTDSNGSGIGTTPSAYGDKYPLVQRVANYGNVIPASAVAPTPSLQRTRQQASAIQAVSREGFLDSKQRPPLQGLQLPDS
jgi:hypothetical protein